MKVQLPEFRSIFEESIFSRFDLELKKYTSRGRKVPLALYESLMQSAAFALRLNRFVQLDLKRTQGRFFSTSAVREFLSDTIYLLNQTWTRIRTAAVSGEFATQDTLQKALDTELAGETLACLSEIWVFGLKERFGEGLFLWIQGFLIGVDDPLGICVAVRSYYQRLLELRSGKKSLLIEPQSLSSISSDIAHFEERKSSREFVLVKHVKFSYWKEAIRHHKKAIEVLESREIVPRELLQMHKFRMHVASLRIEECRNSLEIELGNICDDRIHDADKFLGFDEIKNEYDRFICLCGSDLDASIFLQLNRFEVATCRSCGRLVLPVKRFPHYTLADSSEDEWL